MSNKQSAQGNALGKRHITFHRPVRAKAKPFTCFCPYRATILSHCLPQGAALG